MYRGLDGDPVCLACGFVAYAEEDLAASVEYAERMHTYRAEHRREIAENAERQRYR